MDLSQSNDGRRPAKRSRSSVACNRCKERRQRCDNSAPSCSNCARAGATCVYKGGDHPAWYVESLESRIRQLEESLRLSASQSLDETATPAQLMAPPTPSPTVPPSAPLSFDLLPHPTAPTVSNVGQAAAITLTHPSALATFQPAPVRAFPPSHLGDALGFLSLCAAAEPYYVGSSTGFSLANMVQAAVYDRISEVDALDNDAGTPFRSSVASESPEDYARPIRNLPSTNERPFSCHRPRPTTKPASLPPDDLGDSLMDGYMSKIHRFYPFLDRQKLQAQHIARQQLGTEPLTREDKMALVKLHLVYGIGARHLQLSGKGKPFEGSLPEAHFVAATEHLSDVFELRTTENIEIMLLLSFYSLHSPSGPGAWHLTGMAVRLCVELGLHRNVRGLAEAQRFTDQRRKRLFWSALVLERKVAITLGRPFSLSDADIDVELPADIDDVLRDPRTIVDAMQKAGSRHSNLTPHMHLARLQPLLACIQSHNTRVNELNPPSAEHLANVRAALEQWRDRVQSPHLPQLQTEPALMLEYYKALLILLQPFVIRPKRQQEDVRLCAETVGAICQLYKRIHQKEPAGFFLLELHDVLVAGITLIYCLWLDQPNLDTFSIMNDLGACSTVLFLIAERWQSAKRYRDAFEALVKATMAYKKRHATAHPDPNHSNTPLDVGADGRALFEANIWGDDEGSGWRRMLGEITGVPEVPVDDTWFWLSDMGLPMGPQGAQM